MKIVNLQAAKTHLSRLVEQAVSGEDIILAKAGRPLVRLTPFNPHSGPRQWGILSGKNQVTGLKATFGESGCDIF